MTRARTFALLMAAAMAGAIVMYDRVKSLGRFAVRPVGEGGPIAAPEPHVQGGRVVRSTKV